MSFPATTDGKNELLFYSGLCSFLIVLISLGVYFDIFPKGLVGESGLIFDPNHPIRFWFVIFLFTNYLLWVWKVKEWLKSFGKNPALAPAKTGE